jgi:hypothetical protein
VSTSVWLVYAGATVAPFSHIHEEGLRLRVVTGYGQYSYDHDVDPVGKQRTHFDAENWFADALVGYLWRFDPLTAKAFVGFSAISHDISPLDTESIVIGEDFGVKGVLEFWLNTGPKSWSSLDLSWSSAFNTRAARMRSGYRVTPALSLGIESGINLDAQGECKSGVRETGSCKIDDGGLSRTSNLLDFGRAGLFARYEWTGGEFSVSAGGLGSMLDADGDFGLDPYVTVNWISHY